MRHEGENLDKRRASVMPIQMSQARELIVANHYAASCANTAVVRLGLFYDIWLIGAALWMPPTRSSAEAEFGDEWRGVLTLSRLACIPSAPRNSASYLISQSVKFIKRDPRWLHLVTYADTWRGHTGAIYRACGWEYLGQTKPSPVWVNSDGKMMGRKRGPKNLTTEEMRQAGFKKIGNFPKEKFVLRNIQEAQRMAAEGEA